MKYGFGVDLGGTTVKLAFFDQTGTMLEKWEIPTVTHHGGTQILPDIAAALLDYLAAHTIPREQILGIGIGVPGPVSDAGVVNRCHNLGWGVFNIHEQLGRLTGLPVKAGNDANMAALGEAWKGGARGCENMVLVTLGTGVGGGILINGKPLSGARGAAGEIGHITVNARETVPCSCGKCGCAEQYCSATGIVNLVTAQLAAGAQSPLADLQPLTCKDVFDAAKEGDGLACTVLEQVYDYMGQFLADIGCTLDPEVIVIGGGVSRAGQTLLDGIRPYFDKYIFHASRDIRFALATLGNDAGAYGAFKLILDNTNKGV